MRGDQQVAPVRGHAEVDRGSDRLPGADRTQLPGPLNDVAKMPTSVLTTSLPRQMTEALAGASGRLPLTLVPPRQPTAAMTVFPSVPGCTFTSVTNEVRYGEFVGLGSGLSTVFHDDVTSSAGRLSRP